MIMCKDKKIKYRLMTIILPLFLWNPFFNNKQIVEVRNNGIIIGYIDSKEKIYNACDEIKKEISNEYDNVSMEEINLSFVSVRNDNVNISSEEELKENIKNSCEIHIQGYKFLVNNNMFGILKSKDDGKDILKQVGNEYINKLNLEDKDIELVDVEADTKYVAIVVPVSKIDDSKDIVKRIIDQNNKYPVVKVTVKSRQKETKLKKENIVTYVDNNMYIGERKLIKGFPGKVIVDKEVTYVNGKEHNSKSISEKEVIKPVEDIVYRGNKNPIVDNVRFIDKPKNLKITSPFGHRLSGFHHGIDIAAEVGDNVNVVLDGKVKETGYNFYYGKYIIVNHGNGIDTLYGHCSSIIAKKGDNVLKGQLIALSGNTGNSTGPHIHFELRNNGVAVNPVNYFK